MPLGFTPSDSMSNIITRSGEYLANQLVQTGQKIETALIRGQAFREARDFGQQLSTVNPASDEFPQAVTALAARYPLAIQSGLGVELMKPSVQAYRGYQQGKVSAMQIQGRKDIASIKGGNGMPVYIPEPGGLPNANEDPINVSMGKQGIPGVLSSSFGPMGVAADAAFSGSNGAEGSGEVLPPLPDGTNAEESIDAASAMRRRRPLQSYIEENSKIFNDAISAGKAPPFTRSQISTNAAKQKAADDKEIAALNPTQKIKATFSNSAGELYREMNDGSFLYPDGSKHIAAPNGLTRVAGANEGRRLDQAQEAQSYRRDRNAQTDQAKALKAALDLLKDRETTEKKTLRDFEKQRDANTDSSRAAELQAKVVAQQKLAEETVGRRDGAQKAYEQLLNGNGETAPATEIIERNGKKYEVDHASRKVIREVQ